MSRTGGMLLNLINYLQVSFFWVSPGTEAMFADLGHFTALSIRVSLRLYHVLCTEDTSGYEREVVEMGYACVRD